MAYKVLTHKWRPQTFEEIVGQNHVTRTLANAISLDRLACAYLFAGPHGTGKTSTARILAKALNCVNGPTPNPCNACVNCREITAGQFLDVLEIDGASNRGIDDIRSLQERLSLAPLKARFKVYIIDEVHMLTQPAFNALLKTLEEPPARTLFMFATTDPHKIPQTILSRCQRFDFQSISKAAMIERLGHIAKKEELSVSPEALALIARASSSSMRDGEKLLDQVASYTAGGISAKDVREMVGAVESEYLARLTENLRTRNVAGLLGIVHELLKDGKSPQYIMQDWANWLRDLLVVRLNKEELALLTEEHRHLLLGQTGYFSVADLSDFIGALSSTATRMRYSSDPLLTLEVGLIQLASRDFELETIRKQEPALVKLYEKVLQLEQQIMTDSSVSSSPEFPVSASMRVSEPVKELGKNEDLSEQLPQADKGPGTDVPVNAAGTAATIVEKWHRVVASVKKKKTTLGSFLEKMQILSGTEREIVLGSERSFIMETLSMTQNKVLLAHEVKRVFSEAFSVRFKLIPGDQQKKPAVSGIGGVVQQAIDMFDGELVR